MWKKILVQLFIHQHHNSYYIFEQLENYINCIGYILMTCRLLYVIVMKHGMGVLV